MSAAGLQNVYGIDTNFCGINRLAMSFLLKLPNGHFALFDSGTPKRFDIILRQLQQAGAGRNNLTSLFLTHTHLDHSSNTSKLVKYFPKLNVYGHPITIKRLADPCGVIEHINKEFKKEPRRIHWFDRTNS